MCLETQGLDEVATGTADGSARRKTRPKPVAIALPTTNHTTLTLDATIQIQCPHKHLPRSNASSAAAVSTVGPWLRLWCISAARGTDPPFRGNDTHYTPPLHPIHHHTRHHTPRHARTHTYTRLSCLSLSSIHPTPRRQDASPPPSPPPRPRRRAPPCCS